MKLTTINLNLTLDEADIMQLLTDEEIDNCANEGDLADKLRATIWDVINR